MYSVAPQGYTHTSFIIYVKNNVNGSYYTQKALNVKAQKIINKIMVLPAETVIIVITNTRGLPQKYKT